MKRQLYLIAGCTALALGLIGIPLPLLPTVPFLILAAFCFARSSPKLENWILTHPHYGPPIVAWRQKGIVSRKGKWAATAAFGISITIGLITLAMPWALLPIAVAVTCGTWLWRRPEI
jgi:uncharacterized protein